MKKAKEWLNGFICKHGTTIACCAAAFVVLAANSACGGPFYEPEEPNDLEKFKKFNN